MDLKEGDLVIRLKEPLKDERIDIEKFKEWMHPISGSALASYSYEEETKQLNCDGIGIITDIKLPTPQPTDKDSPLQFKRRWFIFKFPDVEVYWSKTLEKKWEHSDRLKKINAAPQHISLKKQSK